MSFDAERFCEDYNIDIPPRNSNNNDGWVNIKCPHCDDRSNHFGFNIATGQVSCWRCKASNLVKSIQILCDVSTGEAFKIKDRYSLLIDDEKYEKIGYHNTTIDVPGRRLLKQHKSYLASRNFDPDFLEHKYDLRGTLVHELYSYRIITPIYYKHRIVSYQGRDFTNKQKMRYLTCKPEYEIMLHKNILYNLDNCNKKSVIVTEGCYDVFRLGDDSCATFGTGYKEKQALLLAQKFDRIFLVFDGEPQAQETAIQLSKILSMTGKKAVNINLDSGDPAEMSESDVEYMKKDFKI